MDFRLYRIIIDINDDDVNFNFLTFLNFLLNLWSFVVIAVDYNYSKILTFAFILLNYLYITNNTEKHSGLESV